MSFKNKMMKKCLFVGDSITDAHHLFSDNNLGFGYVNMIQQKRPDIQVVNKGYDGFTANRISQMWEKLLRTEKAHIITILIGINDLGVYLCGFEDYHRETYSPENFMSTMDELMQEIVTMYSLLNMEAKVILIEPFVFPWPDKYLNWIGPLVAYRKGIKEIAKKYEATFIPAYDLFQEKQQIYKVEELTTDGIHLTELGHHILAEAWLENVRGL